MTFVRRPARRHFTPVWAFALIVILGVAATSCGGGSIAPDPPPPVVLLDTTVDVPQGVNCTVDYIGAEFTARAGGLVAISVSGPASMAPLFILYAPDFATQLGVSSPAGPGAVSFAFTPTQTGLYHLSICNVNSIGGTVKVVVTQR